MTIPEQDLDEQANMLAHITRELANCCVAKEVELFSRFRLSTSEGHALLAVAEGASSPSALAEQLGVVRSRVTPLVQGLVERGFLQRTESREDRRVRHLRLTREGETIAKEATSFRTDFHARLLSKFDPAARAQLFASLSYLHDKMLELRQGLNGKIRI